MNRVRTGDVLEPLMEVPQSLPATWNDCAVNLNYPDPPAGEIGQPPKWRAKQADGTDFPGGDFVDANAVKDGKRFARGGSWMGEYEGHYLENARGRYWVPVWRTY